MTSGTGTNARLLIGIFLLTSWVCAADTLSGGASGDWRTWVAGHLDSDGKPYWDTLSFDGPNRSIGYLLIGQSPIPLPGAPGAIPFWGQSFDSGTDTGGGPDPDFFFLRSAPLSQITLTLEISARTGVNEFGWYDVSDPGTLHTLFTGAAIPGAEMTADLASQYGFYLRTTGNAVFRTQSSLNPAAETSHQHFSVFRQSSLPGAEIYWLGIEDLTLAELSGGEGGIGDYNDMVIRLAAVPEPSTSVLMGAGWLAAVAALRRRRS